MAIIKNLASKKSSKTESETYYKIYTIRDVLRRRAGILGPQDIALLCYTVFAGVKCVYIFGPFIVWFFSTHKGAQHCAIILPLNIPITVSQRRRWCRATERRHPLATANFATPPPTSTLHLLTVFACTQCGDADG